MGYFIRFIFVTIHGTALAIVITIVIRVAVIIVIPMNYAIAIVVGWVVMSFLDHGDDDLQRQVFD